MGRFFPTRFSISSTFLWTSMKLSIYTIILVRFPNIFVQLANKRGFKKYIYSTISVKLELKINHFSNQTNSVAWARDRTIPNELTPLVGEVSANFLRIEGCRVISAADALRPYSRFSSQEPLLFYQVAPQLYSRGRVDPVPDPLLGKPSSPGNRTQTSGSVAKQTV
jgi:hypothetical protein